MLAVRSLVLLMSDDGPQLGWDGLGLMGGMLEGC